MPFAENRINSSSGRQKQPSDVVKETIEMRGVALSWTWRGRQKEGYLNDIQTTEVESFSLEQKRRFANRGRLNRWQ